MSRWKQQFENHPFRQPWKQLEEILAQASVDDETIQTTVDELNRLRRVVAYIDELLASLDPDLLPLSLWDKFSPQVAACVQQVEQYTSTRQEAHLQSANISVDNLLSYVRPYAVLPKKAAESVNRAARRYADLAEQRFDASVREVEGALQRVDEMNAEIEQKRKHILAAFEKVSSAQKELLGAGDETGIKGQIEELAATATERESQIQKAYVTICGDSDGSQSVLAAVQKDQKAVTEVKKNAAALLTDVSAEVAELRAFHERSFGSTDAEGKRVPGMEDELQDLISRLNDFEKASATKHKSLEDRIEELLPGATSAGLATAYKELKETFKTPIRNASAVFYLSILFLVAVALLSVADFGGDHWISMREFSNWTAILPSVVPKLPLYAALVWLAFFASKRRSEAQRLMQEYAHKEAIASSYMSYKRELDEMDKEGAALRTKLLQTTLDAIARNASVTLDGEHGDKSPTHEAIDAAKKILDIPAIRAGLKGRE